MPITLTLGILATALRNFSIGLRDTNSTTSVFCDCGSVSGDPGASAISMLASSGRQRGNRDLADRYGDKSLSSRDTSDSMTHDSKPCGAAARELRAIAWLAHISTQCIILNHNVFLPRASLIVFVFGGDGAVKYDGNKHKRRRWWL